VISRPGAAAAGLACSRNQLPADEGLERESSSKQIAAELVVLQRTAENHVEHILTKLGFTSQAQVATWAAVSQPDSKAA
jgi:FixJ family two-component response regulator